jgi:hypothetical protein
MGLDTRIDGRLTVGLIVTSTLTSFWKVVGRESRKFPFLDSVEFIQRKCSWKCALPVRISWTLCDLVQWAWSSFMDWKRVMFSELVVRLRLDHLIRCPRANVLFTMWKKYVEYIHKFYVSFYFSILFALKYACMQNYKHWLTFRSFTVASLKPLL